MSKTRDAGWGRRLSDRNKADGQRPRHAVRAFAGIFRKDVAMLASLVAFISDVPLKGKIRFHLAVLLTCFQTYLSPAPQLEPQAVGSTLSPEPQAAEATLSPEPQAEPQAEFVKTPAAF